MRHLKSERAELHEKVDVLEEQAGDSSRGTPSGEEEQLETIQEKVVELEGRVKAKRDKVKRLRGEEMVLWAEAELERLKAVEAERLKWEAKEARWLERERTWTAKEETLNTQLEQAEHNKIVTLNHVVAFE